jgi:hypothetical protein
VPWLTLLLLLVLALPALLAEALPATGLLALAGLVLPAAGLAR